MENNTGKNSGLNKLSDAFASLKATQVASENILPNDNETALGDIGLCEAIAHKINKRIMAQNYPSQFGENREMGTGSKPEFSEKLKDTMSCGLLALQLWRNDKIVKLTDEQNIIVETHFGKRNPIKYKVAASAMWAAFNKGNKFDFGDGETAFNTWKAAFDYQHYLDLQKDSQPCETREERYARYLAKLPQVIKAIGKTKTRKKLARKLQKFIINICEKHLPCEMAIINAGFYKGNPKRNGNYKATNSLVNRLREAGFQIDRRIPVHYGKRYKTRNNPNGDGSSCPVMA